MHELKFLKPGEDAIIERAQSSQHPKANRLLAIVGRLDYQIDGHRQYRPDVMPENPPDPDFRSLDEDERELVIESSQSRNPLLKEMVPIITRYDAEVTWWIDREPAKMSF